jgi:hypothetical protein
MLYFVQPVLNRFSAYCHAVNLFAVGNSYKNRYSSAELEKATRVSITLLSNELLNSTRNPSPSDNNMSMSLQFIDFQRSDNKECSEVISGRSPINDKFTKDLRCTHSSHQRFSEQKKATETHDLQDLRPLELQAISASVLPPCTVLHGVRRGDAPCLSAGRSHGICR